MRPTLVTFLKANYALVVVAAVFVWSALAILHSRQGERTGGGQVVLRLGHWQLEAGVREAFDALARKYHALHPEVTILQEAVPEGTYGQWMTTQLMGGTAPDIMQVGLGGAVPYNVMLGYYTRYLVPLSTVVNQPNPYNKGTPFEGMPWRKTYKDGMRTAYVDELQEYMQVPLSQFGIRIFYNKDLLRKLTGRTRAPRDFREFIEVCRQIRSRTDERGKPYTPIAGSAYHVGMWEGFMADPLTYGAVRRVDFNRDGTVGNDELFVGIMTSRIGFDFPPYEAKFRMLRELTGQFQVGFTGLGRDEAVFLFAQQRAVFISTGTWDAGSLHEQARGVFEVGIMDFPIPARDDPEFGRIVEGPVYERPAGGFTFTVTRTCRHPEVAIDFLQFVGSQQGNQELNRIIGWIPAIEGTTVSDMLEPFTPNLMGVFGAMPMSLGGETIIKWQQLTSLFMVNQINYPEMVAEFEPFYRGRGLGELKEARRNGRRGMIRDEQFMAGIRSMAALAPPREAPGRWIKYRLLAGNRLLYRDLGAGLLNRYLAQGVVTNAIGPYEFSPEVIAKVRERVRGGAGKGN